MAGGTVQESDIRSGRRLGNSLLGVSRLGLGRKPFYGRSGRLINRILDFIGDFASRFLKFLDAGSQSFGQFGQFLGAEQDQNESEDENNLTTAKVKNTEHYIHKNHRTNKRVRQLP